MVNFGLQNIRRFEYFKMQILARRNGLIGMLFKQFEIAYR